MRILVDTHTHTIASDHAYSTILENVAAAARAGLDFIEDKCAQALCALDGGSESEFAELLTETYRYSLYRLREFIAAAGMPEAGKIKIPS